MKIIASFCSQKCSHHIWNTPPSSRRELPASPGTAACHLSYLYSYGFLASLAADNLDFLVFFEHRSPTPTSRLDIFCAWSILPQNICMIDCCFITSFVCLFISHLHRTSFPELTLFTFYKSKSHLHHPYPLSLLYFFLTINIIENIIYIYLLPYICIYILKDGSYIYINISKRASPLLCSLLILSL